MMLIHWGAFTLAYHGWKEPIERALNSQYSLPETFGGIYKQVVYLYIKHPFKLRKSRFQRRPETAFLSKFHKSLALKWALTIIL
ncbi:hypothetical protein PO124_13125 [Bacillus licheniformis]|nr:hypothetical protein [Bacillus licheniformis]